MVWKIDLIVFQFFTNARIANNAAIVITITNTRVVKSGAIVPTTRCQNNDTVVTSQLLKRGWHLVIIEAVFHICYQ